MSGQQPNTALTASRATPNGVSGGSIGTAQTRVNDGQATGASTSSGQPNSMSQSNLNSIVSIVLLILYTLPSSVFKSFNGKHGYLFRSNPMSGIRPHAIRWRTVIECKNRMDTCCPKLSRSVCYRAIMHQIATADLACGRMKWKYAGLAGTFPVVGSIQDRNQSLLYLRNQNGIYTGLCCVVPVCVAWLRGRAHRSISTRPIHGL